MYLVERSGFGLNALLGRTCDNCKRAGEKHNCDNCNNRCNDADQKAFKKCGAKRE